MNREINASKERQETSSDLSDLEVKVNSAEAKSEGVVDAATENKGLEQKNIPDPENIPEEEEGYKEQRVVYLSGQVNEALEIFNKKIEDLKPKIIYLDYKAKIACDRAEELGHGKLDARDQQGKMSPKAYISASKSIRGVHDRISAAKKNLQDIGRKYSKIKKSINNYCNSKNQSNDERIDSGESPECISKIVSALHHEVKSQLSSLKNKINQSQVLLDKSYKEFFITNSEIIKESGYELKLCRPRKKILKPLAAAALSVSLGFAGMLGLYKANMIKFNPLEIFNSKKPVAAQLVSDKKNYYPEVYERASFADSFKHTGQEEAILTSGKLPILMYHKIGWQEDRFTVAPEHFRQQLQKLYEHDFQLVSLEDYVNKNFSSLSPGKKPAIITFDDADEGQFSYATYKGKLVYDEHGNPVVDPDCAVGILDDFNKQYPGFGKKAAFFVDFADESHNYQAPFLQEDLVKPKLLYLLKEGFDVCHHTYSHPDMARCSLSQIEREVEKSKIEFDYYLGEKSSLIKNYLAFPYGSVPFDKKVMAYLNSKFNATFAAWGGLADSTYSNYSDAYYPEQPPRIEISTNLERDVLRRSHIISKSAR